MEFFLLDTLKATFLMESLTQRRTQSRPFFQNQGTFFDFQKGTGEASLPPPLVLCQFTCFLNQHAFYFVNNTVVCQALLV